MESWDAETFGPYQPPEVAKSVSDPAQARPSADGDMGGKEENKEGGKEEVPYCKAWINGGTCGRGDACGYRHCVPEGLTRGQAQHEWVRARKRARSALPSTEGDSVHAEDKSRYRERAATFADWVVETFGGVLGGGGSVLDVAGGRGDLTWELRVVRGLEATVVDPRPVKLTKAQHRDLAAMCSGKAGGGAGGALGDVGGLLGECRRARAEGHGVNGAQCCCAKALVPQRQALFDPCFWGDDAEKELLESCRVVVGLHPDQATEPIIDWALASGTPFAVVPCCVFGRDNPHRRLTDGRPVCSYAEFCDYLEQKGGGRFERCFLKMQGKNQVIFWRGEGARGGGGGGGAGA